MLAALSTGHKLGLGLSALAFIVFALVTTMVVPRYNPDFPGRRKPLYILFCFLFFTWMLAAVVIFGREAKKPEKHEAAAAVIAARR
jgi:hypothetical protein